MKEECKENEHVLYLVSESASQFVYRCSKCGKTVIVKRD